MPVTRSKLIFGTNKCPETKALCLFRITSTNISTYEILARRARKSDVITQITPQPISPKRLAASGIPAIASSTRILRVHAEPAG
jgi:hypothetical protein